ncbi:hypothetical protein SLEP1_g45032 [Rubroshorea leprosula]|uniref:Uncharacterized protein n=1 Tax=Rubroshorea leprosula TaxID=152421 RepID=A0AAV5LHT3_9ROSI|nr:hypothetical protein SLEP1_g45032 [Rubroshorea leprosula]
MPHFLLNPLSFWLLKAKISMEKLSKLIGSFVLNFVGYPMLIGIKATHG